MKILDEVKFDDKGLLPAIVQEYTTGQVLMLAYMNREALELTLRDREAWYFSRSRQELWKKGAVSGHVQRVKEIRYDCDADAILLLVEQVGPACHTGHKSCFYRNAEGEEFEPKDYDLEAVYNMAAGPGIIHELYRVIEERRREMPEGSYTAYLFKKGLDRILKKVGEEASEVIIAAKNKSREEIIYEVSDLIYHLLVLGVYSGVTPEDVYSELKSRR